MVAWWAFPAQYEEYCRSKCGVKWWQRCVGNANTQYIGCSQYFYHSLHWWTYFPVESATSCKPWVAGGEVDSALVSIIISSRWKGKSLLAMDWHVILIAIGLAAGSNHGDVVSPVASYRCSWKDKEVNISPWVRAIVTEKHRIKPWFFSSHPNIWDCVTSPSTSGGYVTLWHVARTVMSSHAPLCLLESSKLNV